jgi:hypothetical protein
MVRRLGQGQGFIQVKRRTLRSHDPAFQPGEVQSARFETRAQGFFLLEDHQEQLIAGNDPVGGKFLRQVTGSSENLVGPPAKRESNLMGRILNLGTLSERIGKGSQFQAGVEQFLDRLAFPFLEEAAQQIRGADFAGALVAGMVLGRAQGAQDGRCQVCPHEKKPPRAQLVLIHDI